MDESTENTTLTAEVTVPNPKLLLKKGLVIVGAAAGMFIGIGAYEHLRHRREEKQLAEDVELFVKSDLPDNPVD